MRSRKEVLGGARRIVVKFGTGLLTNRDNQLALDQIERLAAQVAAIQQGDRQVMLVSSGAIAAGMAELGLSRRPRQLAELQACAAVGQSKLMALYDEVFARFQHRVAQVLLTHDDLRNRTRHLNARQTLRELLDRQVIPIINENDTVSVDEIRFGDNDRLGALTATLIDADLLIILSHVAGLLDGNRLVPEVAEITAAIEKLARGTDRVTSVGGMISKIEAAKIITRAGSPMIIADGGEPDILAAVLDGGDRGTLFLPRTPKLPSRKRWIAFFQRTCGTVTIDDGACRALRESGKSLLAKGVVAVDGTFRAEDLIGIRDKNGVEIARGLAKAGSGSFKAADGVVVHRDDLVIL